MSDENDLKQHEPTSKKLADLKKKGQTLRSKDLSGATIVILSVLLMILMGNSLHALIIKNIDDVFLNMNKVVYADSNMILIFKQMMVRSFLSIMPLLIIIFAAVFLSAFLLGGWNFTLEAVHFKLEKLNPFTNLANIYSKRLFMDVAKAFGKFIIIMVLFVTYALSNKDKLFVMPYLKLDHSVSLFASITESFIFTLFAGIILIALIDVIYSYYTYHEKAMMSTQEVKDETKDAESSADVKRKMKSLQMAILRQKVNLMVPKANVVITNPTHYSIALQYREGKDKAPRVIAKGKGQLAAHIRLLAAKHAIPIYPEPVLARAIFHTCKLNHEVRPELYMAVALVLTFINQLNQYQQGLIDEPVKVTDLQIPPEFVFDK